MFLKSAGKFGRRYCSTSGCPMSMHSITPEPRKGAKSRPGQKANPRIEVSLSFKSIPGPKPSLPFIGTSWLYFPGGRYNLSDLHAANVDKFRRYGPVVKEEFQWRKPLVHLYDPVDIETMFRSQGIRPVRPIHEFVKHYRKQRPEKYESPGLVSSVGEEWRKLRQILSPALMRLDALEGLIPSLNSICDDFIQLIRIKRSSRDKCISHLQDQLYRLSVESVYMLCLENRLGGLTPYLRQDTVAFKMISSVKLLFESFHELFYGLPLWKLFATKSYKKLDTAESLMYETTCKRIQEVIMKIRESNDGDSENEMPGVLKQLLETKELSDKELCVTIIDFLSGGVFTVTNAMSFLLYHMSRNPECQQKLYEELLEHAPDGNITKENLSKLRYVKACVKESFRLTPTIPGIARILPEDIVASGFHIPAGTPVFSNFMVACQHPEIFPNPKEFIPERWLDEKAAINPFALVPFGFGSRMCVGRRFAEMEMHVALAKIIYDFVLESTGQEVHCKQALIIIPSHPVSVIFHDRKYYNKYRVKKNSPS